MKNSIISLAMSSLLFVLFHPDGKAQNEAVNVPSSAVTDSLTLLAGQYLLLEKGIGDSLQAVSAVLAELGGSIEALEQARQSKLETKYQKRLHKISLTPEFVKAANVSLSALCLSNSLTDYLNDVGQLSNPENEDLGVSLTANLSQVIDRQFFKGKDKLGKVQKSRFLSIVSQIVKSPLVSSISSVVPVVSAISSVSNLVSEMAVNNEEVKIEDFQAYQAEMAKYVAFYEALGKAGNEFNTTMNNLGIRMDVLHNLLRNFAAERLTALDPGFVEKHGDMPLNELLRTHYDRDAVLRILKELEKKHSCGEGNATGCELLLQDARLAYPDFALNQARYIIDELETISKEYVRSFNDYQSAVETILKSAVSIAVPEKAEKKTQSLRLKLQQLEKAFNTAVNTEDARAKFQRLAGGPGI